MGHLTRTPTSNDPERSFDDEPWAEATDFMDPIALLLNGFCERCSKCERITRLKHLKKGKCPDCSTAKRLK